MMTPDAMVPEVIQVGPWWTASIRPDLWVAGEWDHVEARNRPGEFVQAFLSDIDTPGGEESGYADTWLLEALHRGYGAQGLAEALVLADLIDAQPWT